jgi:hypothetical protein
VKRRRAAAWLSILLLAGCAANRVQEEARVSCSAGPLAADFGGQPWLAFACDDGRSVALLATPENAAAPFSFVLRPSDHGVRVQGDGAGDRAATAPAFAELMALDADALTVLYTRVLLAPDGD